MELPDELDDLFGRRLLQDIVEHVADEELHRRPDLWRDDRTIGRVALVVGVFEHHNRARLHVLRRLFALHLLELCDRTTYVSARPLRSESLPHQLRHLGRRRLGPEQVPAASFEQVAKNVHIRPVQVVDADLDGVQDRVRGRETEFGHLGEEARILP